MKRKENLSAQKRRQKPRTHTYIYACAYVYILSIVSSPPNRKLEICDGTVYGTLESSAFVEIPLVL